MKTQNTMITIAMASVFLASFQVLAARPTVQWTVTKHSNIIDNPTLPDFSAISFNVIVKDANNLIKYWDANLQTDFDTDLDSECTGANVDVACALNIEISGTMGTFSTPGLDVINEESEAATVLAIGPQRIKVVAEVNRCFGPEDPDLVGCSLENASGNATTFVVETGLRPHPGSYPSTYVHEYLHNVLPIKNPDNHRSTCGFNIMNAASQFLDVDANGNPRAWYNTNAINSTECTRMGGKAFTTRAGTVYTALDSTTEFYFITSSVQPPTNTTMTINAGVEVQVKNGHKFSRTSGGKVVMRPGGTGGPVKIYTNCNSEYCTKTPY